MFLVEFPGYMVPKLVPVNLLSQASHHQVTIPKEVLNKFSTSKVNF